MLYTHEAINALKYSSRHPEEWKHLVAEDDAWGEVITAMAFSVVRQDLCAELRGRNEVDVQVS